MELIVPELVKRNGVTEQLKAENQMEWVRQMNACKAQAELAHTMIYSPWVIYFSILSTQWLVRFIKMKRKSDLVLTILFLILSVLAFAGFIRRLLEVRV